MILYFFIYLVLINIIGFLVMYIDKRKAQHKNYRISEKSLFIVALALGSIGIYIGMYKFRHKTKHLSFTIGIPICFLINLFCVYYIFANDVLIYFSNFFNL